MEKVNDAEIDGTNRVVVFGPSTDKATGIKSDHASGLWDPECKNHIAAAKSSNLDTFTCTYKSE